MTVRELIEELQEIARRTGDHTLVSVMADDDKPHGIAEVSYAGGSRIEIHPHGSTRWE